MIEKAKSVRRRSSQEERKTEGHMKKLILRGIFAAVIVLTCTQRPTSDGPALKETVSM